MTEPDAVSAGGRAGGLRSALVRICILTFCPLYTGCDFLPSSEQVMAGIPSGFSETGGDTRIMPRPDNPESEAKVKLFFSETPSVSDPLPGAEARLDAVRVFEKPEYRPFLLPKIIISSRNRYRGALTVNFGAAAKEIRAIIPEGSFFVGLVPKYSMDWVASIGDGGAVGTDVRGTLAWSKLRSEDVIFPGKISVSSPYHFPEKFLNPLVASVIDPKADGLPSVFSLPQKDALSWMEDLHYGLMAKRWKIREPRGAKGGWVFVWPPEKVLREEEIAPLEVVVLWASAALRDGVSGWIAFAGQDVFFMAGALPPQEGSYVFSPKVFLGEAGRDFYTFSNESRRAYVEALTTSEKVSFLDIRDREFFQDLPRKKPEAGGGGSKGAGGGGAKRSNPFDAKP